MRFVSAAILKNVYRERPATSKKGDYGRLLVIGGNAEFSGAPALVALGALRAGADIVRIASPKRSADIIARMRPDFITVALDGDSLNITHVPKLLELAEKHDAVVIGNGLGSEKKTIAATAQFLKKTKKPCVIDADAIKAFVHGITGKGKIFILTPHAGEFRTLTGRDITKTGTDERSTYVRRAARRFGATILLKGHTDVISDGKNIALNKTGNPYMTKGGTGDVLAGVCGALLAQHNNAYESACAAAYITGAAGDSVAARKKQALLASEVAEAITEVIK